MTGGRYCKMNEIGQMKVMWLHGNNVRRVTVRMEGTRKDGRQRRRETGEGKNVVKIVGKINGLTVGREWKV